MASGLSPKNNFRQNVRSANQAVNTKRVSNSTDKTMIRNLSPLTKIVSMNVAVSVAAILGFAWAASAQSITPQSRPDCAKVVCTTDGAELTKAKPVVTTTVTPTATITQVCRPNSCSSSWVPHEMDEAATGNEPQEFLIPEGDRK